LNPTKRGRRKERHIPRDKTPGKTFYVKRGRDKIGRKGQQHEKKKWYPATTREKALDGRRPTNLTIG